MSKTLQNHQLAYLGRKKTPPMVKNNIKLKLFFPIVLKIVVLFPCVSHFWMQYMIVLHHDEAYLLYILVGHISHQRITSEEELSLTFPFADRCWIKDIRWFIRKEAKRRTFTGNTLSAFNLTSCCLNFSLCLIKSCRYWNQTAFVYVQALPPPHISM